MSPADVLRRFRLVFSAVRAHFIQVQKKAGISGAQLWALSVISAHQELSVGRLASAMDVHQTTASNLVKVLVQQGLVVSQRGVADRRTVQLQPTAKGRRVLRKAPAPASGVLPDALARLDPATLSRLDHDLGMLLEQVRVDERAARTPLAQM